MNGHSSSFSRCQRGRRSYERYYCYYWNSKFTWLKPNLSPLLLLQTCVESDGKEFQIFSMIRQRVALALGVDILNSKPVIPIPVAGCCTCESTTVQVAGYVMVIHISVAWKAVSNTSSPNIKFRSSLSIFAKGNLILITERMQARM